MQTFATPCRGQVRYKGLLALLDCIPCKLFIPRLLSSIGNLKCLTTFALVKLTNIVRYTGEFVIKGLEISRFTVKNASAKFHLALRQSISRDLKTFITWAPFAQR